MRKQDSEGDKEQGANTHIGRHLLPSLLSFPRQAVELLGEWQPVTTGNSVCFGPVAASTTRNDGAEKHGRREANATNRDSASGRQGIQRGFCSSRLALDSTSQPRWRRFFLADGFDGLRRGKNKQKTPFLKQRNPAGSRAAELSGAPQAANTNKPGMHPLPQACRLRLERIKLLVLTVWSS